MSLFVLLFTPAFLLVIFLQLWITKKEARKRTALGFGATVAALLLIYSMCSLNGQYRWTMSGKLRIPGSIALMDQEEWFPAGTDWHRHPIGDDGEIVWNDNVLNLLFAGLIEADRALWHRTKVVI